MMRLLTPLFGIVGVHHPDKMLSSKYCFLKKTGENDVLEVNYELPPEEIKIQKRNLKAIERFYKKLGCLPLKIVNPGFGEAFIMVELSP